MTFVALALVALLAVTVAVFASTLRTQSRAYARREDLLLNQLLHAVGKPWEPAPATPERPESEPRAWTASPEQLPVDQ